MGLLWKRLNHYSDHVMFLEVVRAEYVSGYRIKLWFNNNEIKEVDLSDSLKGDVFMPLKDLNFLSVLLQYH